MVRRVLDFDDLFSSASSPEDQALLSSGLMVFASDTAFVTFKGTAAANGDSYYNSTDHVLRVYQNGAWQTLGQPGIAGSFASPTLITAVGGIVFAGKRPHHVIFVAGNAGPIDISANPQIGAPAFVGQRLTVVGCNDTNTVKLENATSLRLNMEYVMGEGSVLELLGINSTDWLEIGKNHV